MNTPAQNYFIHPQFQAQRTATPTMPMTFRLGTKEREAADKIRAEILRVRHGAPAGS